MQRLSKKLSRKSKTDKKRVSKSTLWYTNLKLKKGVLDGYKVKESVKTRRTILDTNVRKIGWGGIVKRLNILAIFNKYKNPAYTKIFKSDMKYVQDKYNGKLKKM